MPEFGSPPWSAINYIGYALTREEVVYYAGRCFLSARYSWFKIKIYSKDAMQDCVYPNNFH